MLYVGKASNLRNRLRSYLRVSPDDTKTAKLTHFAAAVKYQALASSLQATLVESRLIKTHQPPYNILLKDDKSPLYIILTQDTYPRVLTARKKQLQTLYASLPKSHIFGPFSSARKARDIIKTARRVFKFCNQSPALHGHPCFYTHLNLCSGACVSRVSPEEYRATLAQLKLFLSGRRKRLLTATKQSMAEAANHQNFEQAACHRDQLRTLEELFVARSLPDLDALEPTLESDRQDNLLKQAAYLLHQHGLIPANFPLTRIEAYDISNTQGTLATASMATFINGRPATGEYRRFRIRFTQKRSDPGMLQEALQRRLNHPEWPYPQLIVIDGGKQQLKAALAVVGSRIPTVSLVKRPDRLLIPFNASAHSLRLDPAQPSHALFLRLRDEAHRFAKGYHDHLRRRHQLFQNRLQSS